MAMTIGQVADHSQCSAPTIRYYEDVGLLRAIDRTPNGRRAYGWPQVHRLTFIRRARDLGLSIEQVRSLLQVSDGDPSDCGQARDLITIHLDAVRRRRTELERLEQTLSGMAARCDSTCANAPDSACTVFDDLFASTSVGG
ncbi:MerR family DNA-binding protein [Phenylobacterium sp.]|uniref:MerR family DNA-binding protein n=1 Tax=Phenylobacterium sp. TaxID=1871053 RepID=UPI0030F37ABE